MHLVSSRSEGFGLVILETMAYGVPTIAFDCPTGPASLIENNISGILIPPNNIEQFTDKICYLIENEHARNELAKNAITISKNYEILIG